MKRVATIAIFCLYVLCIGCSPLNPSTPTIELNPTTPPTTSPSTAPTTQPVIATPTENPDLIQVVNGVRIEVKGASVVNSQMEISVCFPLLDWGEWMIQPEPLRMGSYIILPNEFETITSEPATAEKPGSECAIVRYLLDDKTRISSPIFFTISDFAVTPHEMDACEEITRRVATNMLARQTGLVLDCTPGDEWKPKITVISSTVPLDNEQTQQALSQLRDWHVAGSWKFKIHEIK